MHLGSRAGDCSWVKGLATGDEWLGCRREMSTRGDGRLERHFGKGAHTEWSHGAERRTRCLQLLGAATHVN